MNKFKCRVCGGTSYKIATANVMCCCQCSTMFNDIEKFNLPNVNFKKLINDNYIKPIIPKRAYNTDTGYDLFSIESKIIKPGETEMIKTGIAIQFPESLSAEVRPRSGLAYKHNIIVTNSPGTVDNSYRDEIRVLLHNLSKVEYKVNEKDRVAQLVFELPVLPELVETKEFIDKTKRGLGGFGSTGK